jgi:hypothetical protein
MRRSYRIRERLDNRDPDLSASLTNEGAVAT